MIIDDQQNPSSHEENKQLKLTIYVKGKHLTKLYKFLGSLDEENVEKTIEAPPPPSPPKRKYTLKELLASCDCDCKEYLIKYPGYWQWKTDSFHSDLGEVYTPKCRLANFNGLCRGHTNTLLTKNDIMKNINHTKRKNIDTDNWRKQEKIETKEKLMKIDTQTKEEESSAPEYICKIHYPSKYHEILDDNDYFENMPYTKFPATAFGMTKINYRFWNFVNILYERNECYCSAQCKAVNKKYYLKDIKNVTGGNKNLRIQCYDGEEQVISACERIANMFKSRCSKNFINFSKTITD